MRRIALLPPLVAALLASGCASICYPGHDDLRVVSDPPGATASCGDARVVTPGTLRISRRKTPSVIVRVALEGYETREIVIARKHLFPAKPWTVPALAAALGAWAGSNCDSSGWPECAPATLTLTLAASAVAAAGIAVDSACPRTYALPRKEFVLRLEPVRPDGAQEGDPR